MSKQPTDAELDAAILQDCERRRAELENRLEQAQGDFENMVRIENRTSHENDAYMTALDLVVRAAVTAAFEAGMEHAKP